MPVRDIVVVGFSAGGIEPLLRLVEALPADFPGAVFVVHHFPPQSVSALPNILHRRTVLDVVQAVDGDAIVPGRIYVGRPDQHLVLTGGRVRCTNGPREQGHRPAIDPLFRSAARTFGSRVVGVILSGTLDDGTVGLIEIKARNGLALVQEPEEAAYPGMIMSALRKRGSMAGRCPCSRGPLVQRTRPPVSTRCWSGRATQIRPGRMTSPSTAWVTSSAEARRRMLGSALTLWGGKWWTTNMAPGKSAGSPPTSRRRGSMPPAENPTTAMSRTGMPPVPFSS
jgi:hypothetical protein